MTKGQSSQGQLRFRWETDNALWNRMNQTQQRLCQELLSQLLTITANDKKQERSPDDEREDSTQTS